MAIFLVAVTSAKQTNPDVIVKVNAPKVTVEAGRHSVIQIVVEIKNGYHIQANKVSNESMIPTTLDISSDKSLIVKKQVFPSAKKFKLEGTEEYLDVYDGRFDISIFFNTSRQTKKGLHRLDGKLNYQACDSIRCLFPRAAGFSMEIEVR